VVRLRSSSILVRKIIAGLFAASGWTAMLIVAASGETAPPSGTQAGAVAWGVTGSAPQTGSSAHTSGHAFKIPAPGTSGQNAAPAAPPPKIRVVIDKPTQEMKVFVDGVERYTWKVSTGLRSFDTPSGTYTARSMNEMWYSREWDDAPMPHAIFFSKRGHAIHGTGETKRLGRPASHGCVRLAPENARTLFALVKKMGLKSTEIVLNGDLPREEVKATPAKKPAKIVQDKKKPASTKSVARAGAKQKSAAKQQKPAKQASKPKKAVGPYAAGAPRPLSRQDWLRLYYSYYGYPRPRGYWRY
jgi:lipoprotein-anchoring transpeptidase ErfK/SrfK